MSTPQQSIPAINIEPPGWWTWLPVAIGLLAIGLPVFLHLAQTTWETEENGHGPIILLVACWLIWIKRQALVRPTPAPGLGWKLLGWATLVVSLLAFVVGLSQGIDTLEVATLIPILASIVLLMRGWVALRALWFPLLFLLFMIPLPGMLVELITGALKQQVSGVAESLLYAVGYPIARVGVILSIGQYKLLVADACSGLNSMFSLSALGLLYLYIMRYHSWLHVGLLLLAILPIAFFSNVIRVITLVLITYHFGDAAGQGFAHMASGMVLFVIALLLLVSFDQLLRLTLFRRELPA